MEGSIMGEPTKDARWRQRFQNYSRAFSLLRDALEGKNIGGYSALEQEGVIQRFEYTFELGWKTLKDYLEYSGVSLAEATARSVIKECAAVGVFASASIDGNIYLEMMLARNALSHMYDFERFAGVIAKMKSDYLPQLKKEYDFFVGKEMNGNG
jgi:nucleotidyltransferase substrate binding protein (TIGR01987 family)